MSQMHLLQLDISSLDEGGAHRKAMEKEQKDQQGKVAFWRLFSQFSPFSS